MDADDGVYELTQEDLEDREHLNQVWDRWILAGKKCLCGAEISFEDALHLGRCIDCLHKESGLTEEGW